MEILGWFEITKINHQGNTQMKVIVEDVKAMLKFYIRKLEGELAKLDDDPLSNEYHYNLGLYNGYKDAYEMLTGELPILRPKR